MLEVKLERLKDEMDRKLPSLESELAELKEELKNARKLCTDL